MSTATFSIRMDSQLKRELDAICNEFGMSTSVAINVFARAVVRERRIPFEIAATPKASEPQRAFRALREQAKQSGVAGLSLSEINAEISKARAEQ
ncbi:MAG: type II toxin-antitoxin system RelB/DinJ family antitoxin [Lentisphaerae bacterium]|jgi:addiction module RelB/DinJ family antitoxin|nr:type II toxin-antitoxin system RelB/DinJ family antitoxin [Lentisphaerota bacterium]